MVDLMGKKFYFFGLSIIILIAGFVVFLINGGANGGLKMDIQFKGGAIMEIQMNEDTFKGLSEAQAANKRTQITERAEEIVKSTINKEATAQISQTLNAREASKKIDLLTINIATAMKGEETNTLADALKKDAVCSIKADAQMQVQNVQPFIGKEILNNGLYAVFWASLFIIIYIWIRFKVMSGLSAGVMAIVALLHDVLIMLAVYIIFRIPLNDAFIAAVLTVIGYSMNDTIIIYDRIRENNHLLKKTKIAELVNKSIIQTLNRSINTIVTVLICIITVYIFASYHNINSIKDFTLPLIIGITSGCYSSIFIASPLWVLWKESQTKKNVKGKVSRPRYG